MSFRLSVRDLVWLAVFTGNLSVQIAGQESLVVTNTQTGQIQVMDAARLNLKESHSVGHLEGAVLGSNGRLYYSDVYDVVGLLDLNTGQRIVLTKPESRLLRSHFGRPSQLALSPDNRFLVLAHHGWTGSGNIADVGTFSLSVVDADSGNVICRIPPEEEQLRTSDAAACMIPQILFSPNGAKLYELCLWGGSYPLKPTPLLRVVDMTKKTLSGTLTLPRSHVAALAPDGQNLYVLSERADLLVVNTGKLKVTDTWNLPGRGGPTSIRFGASMMVASNNQQLYFTGGLKETTLYALNVRSQRLVSRLDLNEPIEDFVTSTNGDRVYLLSSKGLICLDATDWRELARVEIDAVSPRKCFLKIVSARSQ